MSITNRFFFLTFFALFLSNTQSKTLSIMLEPAGDAKHAGRTIDDCFERGITLQFCESLKKNIEQQYTNVRVILSRFPGETLEALQNANFANRLNIDLYISIHFLYEQKSPPTMWFYQFCYHPVTDFWQKYNDSLQLITVDQAHIPAIQTTQTYIEIIATNIKNNESSILTNGPYTLPFKPLIGIAAPAIGIEATIAEHYDYHMYIGPIAKSLARIINNDA